MPLLYLPQKLIAPQRQTARVFSLQVYAGTPMSAWLFRQEEPHFAEFSYIQQ
jgi:hypothetical protein